MENIFSVKFNNVRFCYDEVCAINNVNITIKKNSLTAIIGPNGGGKSTLLKLLSGLLSPDEGTLQFNKQSEIGYVSQFIGFDMSFPMTVLEMVLLGTLCKHIKPFCKYKPEQKEKAENALSRVGLSGYDDRGINQLSGGELKRAVIARALASDADIIVLDEPDGNLDVEAASDLYNILSELKVDKTIIIVSHHLNEVLDIADSALYVNSTVTAYDSPEELRKKLKDGIII